MRLNISWTLFGFTLCALLGGCDSNPAAPGVKPTMAEAGPIQVAAFGDTVNLVGSYLPADSITAFYWQHESHPVFVQTDSTLYSFIAPSVEDSNFYCIFRVVNRDHQYLDDTTWIWITQNPGVRFFAPKSGDIFHIGDTITIQFWPVEGDIGMDIYLGDESFFGIPTGLSESYNPKTYPIFKYPIPVEYTEKIYDFSTGSYQYDTTSAVSDSCRIRATSYLNSDDFTESDGYFSIIP